MAIGLYPGRKNAATALPAEELLPGADAECFLCQCAPKAMIISA